MKIGIIGAGKIGMAMGELAEKFAKVVYIDIKKPFSCDYNLLCDADINFIAVNTTTEDGYNMKNIKSCLSKVKVNGLRNVVILSTCPPSFFNDEKIQAVYSPLFIRQGSIKEDILNAEFVLIGTHAGGNEESKVLKEFYKKINKKYEFACMSQKEAATVKMGINGFLTLKIVYANMLGDYCIKEKMNPEVVLDAIATCKSINHYYFKYGDGFGGPCLPIDNRTLSKEIGKLLPLIIDQENKTHLDFQLSQFIAKNEKSLEYTFEGVSYKKGVPIIVHSQRLELAEKLARLGYKIKIKESKEVCNLINKEYPDLFLFEEI